MKNDGDLTGAKTLSGPNVGDGAQDPVVPMEPNDVGKSSGEFKRWFRFGHLEAQLRQAQKSEQVIKEAMGDAPVSYYECPAEEER